MQSASTEYVGMSHGSAPLLSRDAQDAGRHLHSSADLAQREAAVGITGRNFASRVAEHAARHDAILLAQYVHQADLQTNNYTYMSIMAVIQVS